MTKTPLRDVNEIQVTRTRRKLKSTQINEQDIAGKNMVYSNEKPKGKSIAIEKVIATEKENTPNIIRRSKRTAITECVTRSEPPEEPKTSKSSAKIVKAKRPASKKLKSESKSKKGHSATTIKSSEDHKKTNLSQTKLDFPIIEAKEVPDAKPNDEVAEDVCKRESEKTTTSICSAVTEDSGFGTAVSNQNSPNFSMAVFHSPDVRSTVVTPYASECSILTTDSPPLSYWKELAEQRRMALEKALYENEQLHDQLEVLEAENHQLKQIVKEADVLAQVVKGIME